MLTWLRIAASRLAGWFGSSRLDADFDDELQTHLAMLADDNVRRGMTPGAAARAARLTLGGPAQISERQREHRGLPLIDTLAQDLRYGLRAMRRDPGFTAVAVLTLAIGIAANTAIFSIVNGVLLRPLPYADPGRLVIVWTDDPKHDVHEEGVSYPNFEDWRTMSRSFEDMAIVSRSHSVTLTAEDPPQHVEAAVVSPNLFSVLGVQPELGRAFSTEDVDRAARTIVLSHGLWQRRFGGARAAIGETLQIDGESWVVIGVMPASFQFPAANIQFWKHMTSARMWPNIRRERYGDWGRVVGRLKPRITVADAQRDLNAIGKRLELAYPPSGSDAADFAGFGVNVVPLAIQITGRTLPLALTVLSGAVLFVLLIACANVANLLLARGAARQREIAIRRALGAGRLRILRQLLTESVLLAALAGGLGIALATIGVRGLVALAPSNVPRLDEARIDALTLAFTTGISLLAALFFGLAPAARLAGTGGGLPSRSWQTLPGATRLRGALVIAELALSAVLLCSAGLLVRSFQRVQAVDPGFQPDRVLTMRVDPRGNQSALLGFYREVYARVGALPGVIAVGAIEDVLQRRNPDYGFVIPGRTAQPAEAVSGDAISAGAFKALGVRVVRGRLFSDRDRGRRGDVVINETMARHLWPDEDPIGKRLRDAGAVPTDPDYFVIGVASDMRRQGLEREPIAQIFWPHDQRTVSTMDLVVRTATDPARLAPAVLREIRAIDRHAPIYNVVTLEQRLDASLSPRRFATLLLGVLSAIALGLASIGIYGLMHYSVAQRTREIGIRMALGAQARDVLRMVLQEGARLAAMGLVTGLAGAMIATRLFSSLLFEVTPTDPLTFALVPALMAALALAACGVAARRAARIDPLIALREE